MRFSLKESRMKLLNATNLDRKSGIRGPNKMGEAPPQPFKTDRLSYQTMLFSPAMNNNQSQPGQRKYLSGFEGDDN
jgi:hypothetical protein